MTQAGGLLPPDGPRLVPREGLLRLVSVCAMVSQVQGQKGRQRAGNTSRSWQAQGTWQVGDRPRKTCPAPPPATPAGRLSRGVWDPFGEAPQGEPQQRPQRVIASPPPAPRWQSPAPLCLPGPSGPRAPQALATHAWTGPWEDKVPSKRSPSARGPKRTAGQEVGAGGWQGTHGRLVQGTQSK